MLMLQTAARVGQNRYVAWSAFLSTGVSHNAVPRYFAPAEAGHYVFVRNASTEKSDILGLDIMCGLSSTYINCKPCKAGDTIGQTQASDRLTDGCSAPALLGDNPSGLPGCSFLSPCDAHDCCYSTCRASKLSCDVAFYNAMQSKCTSCSGGSLWKQLLCDFWAFTYYTAVLYGGNSSFNEDQQTYCRMCRCCWNLRPL